MISREVRINTNLHTNLKKIVNRNCDYSVQFSSVQFSRSVVSDALRTHESQHARPPCPSPSPGVHSDSRPSSPSCHPAISSWVVPFSSCPQSLPASESFPMSQLFTSGGQSTGASALASFRPKCSHSYIFFMNTCFENYSDNYSDNITWHLVSVK